MEYKIRGNMMQTVDIQLTDGESVYTEAGGMCWMSGNVEMSTSTRGGLMAGFKRALAGESMFMTTYTARGGQGLVSFSNEFPGTVMVEKLAEGQSLICQRDSFMVAEESVKLELQFRKRLGTGFFGGEGFFLQKVSGPGIVFLELAGEVTEYNLESGQQLKIDPGHIALFEPTVSFDLAKVQGVKNVLFSGEGLFMASLTGPGRAWLQSMPIANLARKISMHMPSKSS